MLYTALFGEEEANEIEMREALIKGLIPKKTQDRLSQLLSTKSRQHFINVVTWTAWDTFYKQVWRIRCEKIIEWEKREEITGKTKRKSYNKKKNPNEKRKACQQEIEEKKKKAKEKEKRIEEEVRKTILGLVVEGKRPFHYGL